MLSLITLAKIVLLQYSGPFGTCLCVVSFVIRSKLVVVKDTLVLLDLIRAALGKISPTYCKVFVEMIEYSYGFLIAIIYHGLCANYPFKASLV